MSEEVKPCPLCGNPLQIVHRNGSKYVRCIICIFESARHGEHISDDELIKRCNRRPEEDRLKAENERLKEALKQIAYLRNLNTDIKSPLFISCAEDGFCNLYCTMGDIAIKALRNSPDMDDGRKTETNGDNGK